MLFLADDSPPPDADSTAGSAPEPDKSSASSRQSALACSATECLTRFTRSIPASMSTSRASWWYAMVGRPCRSARRAADRRSRGPASSAASVTKGGRRDIGYEVIRLARVDAPGIEHRNRGHRRSGNRSRRGPARKWRDCPDTKLCPLTGTEQSARPTGAEQEPRAIEPEAARMILTATSRIEAIVILQHHDPLTGRPSSAETSRLSQA